MFIKFIKDNSELNKTKQDLDELKDMLDFNYGFIFWVLVGFSSQLIYYIISFEESGEFTLCKKIRDVIKGKVLFLICFDLFLLILGAIWNALPVLFLLCLYY